MCQIFGIMIEPLAQMAVSELVSSKYIQACKLSDYTCLARGLKCMHTCNLKIWKIQKPDEEESKVILNYSDHKSDEEHDT